MPREIVTKVIVYEFTELDEAAQQKAVADIRGLLDGAWWDSNDNDDVQNAIMAGLAEALGTPGWDKGHDAQVPNVRIDAWSLDRRGSVALVGTLDRQNAPKLPWVDGIDSVDLTAKLEYTDVTVEEAERECTCADAWTMAHDPGCPFTLPSPVTPEQERAIKEAVQNAISAAWEAGEAEAEHKTSEEYARSLIKANGYEFTVDGEIYKG